MWCVPRGEGGWRSAARGVGAPPWNASRGPQLPPRTPSPSPPAHPPARRTVVAGHHGVDDRARGHVKDLALLAVGAVGLVEREDARVAVAGAISAGAISAGAIAGAAAAFGVAQLRVCARMCCGAGGRGK